MISMPYRPISPDKKLNPDVIQERLDKAQQLIDIYRTTLQKELRSGVIAELAERNAKNAKRMLAIKLFGNNASQNKVAEYCRTTELFGPRTKWPQDKIARLSWVALQTLSRKSFEGAYLDEVLSLILHGLDHVECPNRLSASQKDVEDLARDAEKFRDQIHLMYLNYKEETGQDLSEEEIATLLETSTQNIIETFFVSQPETGVQTSPSREVVGENTEIEDLKTFFTQQMTTLQETFTNVLAAEQEQEQEKQANIKLRETLSLTLSVLQSFQGEYDTLLQNNKIVEDMQKQRAETYEAQKIELDRMRHYLKDVEIRSAHHEQAARIQEKHLEAIQGRLETEIQYRTYLEKDNATLRQDNEMLVERLTAIEKKHQVELNGVRAEIHRIKRCALDLLQDTTTTKEEEK